MQPGICCRLHDDIQCTIYAWLHLSPGCIPHPIVCYVLYYVQNKLLHVGSSIQTREVVDRKVWPGLGCEYAIGQLPATFGEKLIQSEEKRAGKGCNQAYVVHCMTDIQRTTYAWLHPHLVASLTP